MNSGEQYTYQGIAYVCKVPLSGTPYTIPANTMLACGLTEGRLQQIHALLDTAVDYEGPEHLIDSASAPDRSPPFSVDRSVLPRYRCVAVKLSQNRYSRSST